MKHSYDATCDCPRCTKERARRHAQARSNVDRRICVNGRYVRTAKRIKQTGLDRWARDYYETEGGIDQFDPEDR